MLSEAVQGDGDACIWCEKPARHVISARRRCWRRITISLYALFSLINNLMRFVDISTIFSSSPLCVWVRDLLSGARELSCVGEASVLQEVCLVCSSRLRPARLPTRNMKQAWRSVVFEGSHASASCLSPLSSSVSLAAVSSLCSLSPADRALSLLMPSKWPLRHYLPFFNH